MSSLRTLLPSVMLLAACAPAPGPGVDTDTDTDLPDPGGEDTGWYSGESGSLVLRRTLEADGTLTARIYGLFYDQDQGILNTAACALDDAACHVVLPPAEDDYIRIDRLPTWAPDLAEYRWAGLDVAIGPYEAHYVNDLDGMPHYFADLTDAYAQSPAFGWMGVRFGGTWGDHQGDADIYVSPDLELTTPRPNSTVAFNDTDTVLLQWTPDGWGPVLLEVRGDDPGTPLNRLYLLEDDGYFELRARDLGLGPDEVTLSFTMSRWNQGTVGKYGNQLDVLVTSEVEFTGEYFFVGGRDELAPADTCMQAATLPSTAPGSYWGELADAGFTDDLVRNACRGRDARGEEAVLPIDLAPLEQVSAVLTIPNEDASLYVLADCADDRTCLAGQDSSGVGGPEGVTYFNDTGATRRVYLVVDGVSAGVNGRYELDLDVSPIEVPEMHDTCVQAMQQTAPLSSGSYYTDFLAYTPGTDPGEGGCTGTSLPGADSMTRIRLLPGETLTANIEMKGSDPALYLLYQCNSTASCAAGADLHGATGKESLVYENRSGQTENLFLVVDTRSAVGLRPYFLTLDIR